MPPFRENSFRDYRFEPLSQPSHNNKPRFPPRAGLRRTRRESNSQPSDPQSDALSIKLRVLLFCQLFFSPKHTNNAIVALGDGHYCNCKQIPPTFFPKRLLFTSLLSICFYGIALEEF